MTKQIAIIDPYVKSPAIHCFNRLIYLLGLKSTYHTPSNFGVESLMREASKSQAYIVLGSASHIHENLPWHRPLGQFLLEELNHDKPVLGCCFGHQLVCHILGAKVDFYQRDETKQSGTRTITVTEDFWNFKKGESYHLGVSHRQIVKNLPKGLKAVGLGLENDIVIHETLPFMGTQAHPEASTHFCDMDIQNLTPSEINSLQQDGGRLILQFFQYFNLI
jgi:GMP synthase-like glutamine amidotransferase